MILTDREIQAFIDSRHISIDPPPAIDCYSSTSVDLTLDEPGETWEDKGGGEPIRPGADNYRYDQLSKRKKKIALNGYIFRPKEFILAYTKETIILPNSSRVAARVEGKSSIARLGLCVHITAPTIHAGFAGQIQLEMCNFGPNHVILDAGMKICQLIFEVTLGTPSRGYSGIFSGQSAA